MDFTFRCNPLELFLDFINGYYYNSWYDSDNNDCSVSESASDSTTSSESSTSESSSEFSEGEHLENDQDLSNKILSEDNIPYGNDSELTCDTKVTPKQLDFESRLPNMNILQDDSPRSNDSTSSDSSESPIDKIIDKIIPKRHWTKVFF